jgi:CRISPR-associated protein Csb3
MSITVNVDPCNPGQFFACCGLLELADRLWPGAEGWFADDGRTFSIVGGAGTIAEFIQKIATATVTLKDADDIYGGRVHVGEPFRAFTIDWWHELGGPRGVKDFKVWAGTMESYGIARAMQLALDDAQFRTADVFNGHRIVADSVNKKNKKEPYYFDARRGPNAHSRDVGFSPNDLSMSTEAFPAVEFLCLVGLQRSLPAKTKTSRVYDYFTWSEAIPVSVLPAAVSGLLPHVGARGYRFENWFRTGQRKHKAFMSAIPHNQKVPNE